MVAFTFAAPAQSAPLTPKQIIKRAMDQQAFRNEGAEMKIQLDLLNKSGATRQRTLHALALRQDNLSKILARVTSPADVAGMAFLFRQKKSGGDDQYMYLPALKVTRRIAGSQKNAKFLGSQFTYGDLEWRSVEEARYKTLPEEKVGGKPCHVIEARPTGESPYSSLKLWIRKQDNTMLRMQFFDQQKRLKKVLFVKRVERISGKPIATRMKMKNVQTGDTTLLIITNIRFRKDLTPEMFSTRELKKR